MFDGLRVRVAQNYDNHVCLYSTADVVIRERLKDVEKVENENVKLQCKVKNPKNYSVSWLKDGKVLQQDDR